MNSKEPLMSFVRCLGLIALVSCSSREIDPQVRAAFAAEYPGCVLLSFGPGEGDASAVYYRLEYTCEDQQTRHEEWQFMRIEGAWRRTHVHR